MPCLCGGVVSRFYSRVCKINRGLLHQPPPPPPPPPHKYVRGPKQVAQIANTYGLYEARADAVRAVLASGRHPVWSTTPRQARQARARRLGCP